MKRTGRNSQGTSPLYLQLKTAVTHWIFLFVKHWKHCKILLTVILILILTLILTLILVLILILILILNSYLVLEWVEYEGIYLLRR